VDHCASAVAFGPSMFKSKIFEFFGEFARLLRVQASFLPSFSSNDYGLLASEHQDLVM
jgi:hypothetical protein